ncbi:heavy-metal-associated domain-containing protein [Pseudoalteromonas byunsanensis]|uniref:HMA domain-containing protein n=1 Tax=Pseudoalteromonas byunsanensis TaxID=327939 RepID=A0A1S1N3L4_9GAMM|nr:heavy metal-associated domain-containing protein [Pseudoalteromonas byunsanensis]OHU94269.1 hypothetical protein BIW53_14385 [Pseudoalteromonas byunsanensis]
MLEFEISNMSCSLCAEKIKVAIKNICEQCLVQIDLNTKRMTVESQLKEDILLFTLDEMGYKAKAMTNLCCLDHACKR